jgi:hypothetical protein
MKAAAAFAIALTAAGPSEACTLALSGEGWQQLETTRYVVAFRPQPAPSVGQLFTLDLALCAKAGDLPQRVQVDAWMPAHRHGMNYAPSVQALPEGRYRAEGLLLHMPGRGEFQFELSADGRTDRLAAPFDLDG